MYDTCFKEVKVIDIPFDKSIKQCGKESSGFFSIVMKSIFAVLQQSLEMKSYRLDLKVSHDKEEERVPNFNFC